MMLRAFENADITHVEGDVNPVRDIDIINEELLLKVGEGEIGSLLTGFRATAARARWASFLSIASERGGEHKEFIMTFPIRIL